MSSDIDLSPAWVLDTETTGLSWRNGDRIIEVGAVEILNRKLTGRTFHAYVDPGFEIPEEATKVHGLTREDVVTAGGGQRFEDVADDFLKLIGNACLIIHNASFDVGFLDFELGKAGCRKITGYNTVFDTLKHSRRIHPEKQKHTLDELCKRYGIDSFDRSEHGALLDSQILAQVYFAMTQSQKALEVESEPDLASKPTQPIKKFYNKYKLPLVDFTDDTSKID